jgi:hypothetical protein
MSVHSPPAALGFHELLYLDDGDEVVVGRRDVDSYGVFPADGAALLRRLAGGADPGEAAAWYLLTYGETVDLDEFIATLRDLGFIRADDERQAGTEPVRWQRLGRAMFSPAAWALYIAVIVSSVAVCVVQPELAPQRANVFFTEYLTVIELTVFFGQLPLILLHELFHVLAGRRLGLRSQVRLANRLYFVVFETSLDGLVSVPRRARYLPMLAGMVADVLVIAALTLTAWLTRDPDGEITLLGAVCLALAFTTVPRILWQFYFFMRTDVYYLVATVLGCLDLHTTSRELVANRVNAVLGRTDRLVDEARWHPRDREVARWYAPLYVVGYGVMAVLLVTVLAPLAWQFFGSAVGVVLDRGSAPDRILDAAVVLILAAGQLALAAGLALRARRARRPRTSANPSDTPGTP